MHRVTLSRPKISPTYVIVIDEATNENSPSEEVGTTAKPKVASLKINASHLPVTGEPGNSPGLSMSQR